MILSRRAGLLGLLGLLGASASGCAAGAQATTAPAPAAAGSAAASLSPEPGASASEPDAVAADPLPAGVVNALVVGTDSARDDTNTDVLVLAQLSADRRRLTLVSVPRDCYVPLAGGAHGKVNAALSEHGTEGLVRTVSDLFGGLPIAYAAQTNFTDFVTLCRRFDGFRVRNRVASQVTSDVTHEVTRFPAGELQLHGADWLIYARQRHGLPHGDFDRGERHRAILTGLLQQAKGASASGPAAIAALIRDAAACVRLRGLTPRAAVGLASALGKLDAGAITSLRVPTANSGTVGDVVDAVFVDERALAELAAGLRAGDVTAYLRAHQAQ